MSGDTTMTGPETRPLARVFLLSPAHCGGRRAAALLRPDSTSLLAARLRDGTLSLGEAFAFMSSLYFRGKLAYAQAFAAAGTASFVITPTRGLLAPDTPVSAALLREFASTDIADGGARYREPLERDLAALHARLSPAATVVLLGSIATSKYVDAIAAVVGDRLHYPPAFVGRGDMSRGGLLLRSAASGVELDYAPLTPATIRRGPRPARLGPPATRGLATGTS